MCSVDAEMKYYYIFVVRDIKVVIQGKQFNPLKPDIQLNNIHKLCYLTEYKLQPVTKILKLMAFREVIFVEYGNNVEHTKIINR